MKNKFELLGFILIIFLFSFVSASEVNVWQGQYYNATAFQIGNYTFNFTIYDSLTGGTSCFSNETDLETGNWGQWKTEQFEVGSSCNNASQEYFLNINIDGTDQTPRRRLTMFDYLRRDVSESLSGNLVAVDNITASWFFGKLNASWIQNAPWITSAGADTIWDITGSNYLVNNSNVLDINETKLNLTIENLDNDTLLQLSCANGQLAKWNTTSSYWNCADDRLGSNTTGDIDSVNTNGPYLTGGTTSNDVYLLLNETKFNLSVDARVSGLGGNASWNESYADTKYASIIWGYNQTYTGGTYNATYDMWAYNQTGASGDGSYNATYALWAYNQTYTLGSFNLTYANWNKTYADTLYSTYLSGSYNATYDLWSYNQTSVSSGTYNATYDLWSYNQTYTLGSYNLTYANWNKTYADTLYSDIIWNYNQTYIGGTYNATYNIWAYNQTAPAISWTQSQAYLQNGTGVWFTEINSTGNITTEEIHFEQDPVNHRIYDNSTCVIIKGDTSTMYIC